ncbi:two-component system sensor histidine kinase NtrB [Sandaracinobacteroides saxicola]|uniref:histidine kinase n=1 Tax=Sandaracinobacteroides saxicola TaxID=2759707 RepID=A0A7G5ILP4_9SPHN|nr:ATP-binding protein [Sandaracinobacteroides saxicola]QMW24286.1 two-component sensor histidine kinase [Sandaracinobacteroides saxicola]
MSLPLPLDIWNALPIPTLLLDPDGQVALANTAAETFLNASQGQLAERGWDAQLPPDSPLRSVLAEARAGGSGIAAYDLDVVFIGGRRSRADVMVGAVPDAPGWLTLALQPRAVTAMVDRQMGQAGAARSAVGVAAMLAHEIKNPLSGIRGAAQLLNHGADAETRELTGLIVSEVDRVATLIDRMEGFTDTRPRRPQPENIHAILSHVRKLAETGFARGLSIRERYDPSLPPVLGSRDALVQLFLNLLKNAAEASPKNGEIEITTAYRHGLRVAAPGGKERISLPLEVCVIDQGAGPPPAVADHMFDPFVSSKRGGSGLGLALVAKVAGDHGGVVEFERRGSRTLFRVLLPVGKGQA